MSTDRATKDLTRITLNDHVLALIQKYDRPGPRYTSFPPANHFSETTDPAALLADCRTNTGGLSLYFHLPYCETLCWFCGCHMLTSLNRDLASDYLDYLIREIDLMAAHVDLTRPVTQLHFGGGTPNFLTPEQIDRLGEAIHERFTFADDAELSVELDPRILTQAHAQAFSRMGINRASFGVQDTNEDVQKAIHRVQPHEQNIAAMQWLREAGVRSINIDLIYGLPLQTEALFADTLDKTLSLEPDRFAVFNYAHVPWMKPAQKILERHPMPKGEAKLRLLKQIIETLTGNGFQYIGMDHFARADDELVIAQQNGTLQRNFQGYSTHGGSDILSFGISAISQTPKAYRQNIKDLPSYQASIDKGTPPLLRGYLLSDEDVTRRAAIMQLMCNLHLDIRDFEQRWNLNFTTHFASELDTLTELETDALLSLSSDRITITERGRLFLRNIAMAFDPYLKPEANRYSRTV